MVCVRILNWPYISQINAKCAKKWETFKQVLQKAQHWNQPSLFSGSICATLWTMAHEWDSFNERLSTFTGNWPWAWKSKTESSKTMHSKDARSVYVRVRALFYTPGWCVQVWRERTVDLFVFALFIIVFSSLDSWQRQSEMSRKGRVINHGMEVGFWARLVHSIGFLPLLSSALNEREGTRGNSGWSVNTLSCFYWSQSTQTENNTKNKKHKPLTDLCGPVYTWC